MAMNSTLTYEWFRQGREARPGNILEEIHQNQGICGDDLEYLRVLCLRLAHAFEEGRSAVTEECLACLEAYPENLQGAFWMDFLTLIRRSGGTESWTRAMRFTADARLHLQYRRG